MKRIKWISMIFLLFIVIGASYYLLNDVYQDEGSVFLATNVENTDIEDGYEVYLEKYELIDESKNTSVFIEYPQIKERDKSDVEKKINSLLNELAISYYDAEFSKGLNLEIKAKVMHNDSNLISVKYEGLSHYDDTMKVNNIVFATNIDLKTGNVIKLEDAFNEKFEQKLNQEIFVYNGLDKVNEGDELDPNSHEYGYVNADKEIIYEMFLKYYSSKNSDKFYFGENYLGIIVKVPSGPLVYLELAASYLDLSECMRNNVIWENLLESK